MELGMIGLGRMGANMTRRLRAGGVDVTGFDRDAAVVRELVAGCGMTAAATLADAVNRLPAPRVVWLMLPAGGVTETAVAELAELLAPGDTVVDGGNAWYRDSIRRGALLALRGIEFVDAGVSGGIWGRENGYSLMVGATDDAYARVAPLLEVLAPAADRGLVHTGPVGSGHFVKMIHNGIEYGMMQAYAEGLALMQGRDDWTLDLAAITEAWRHGSVVQSWLLDLTAGFLASDQALTGVQPYVRDSGEGRWTAIEAIERGIPAPVITAALMTRFASRDGGNYAARLLAKMRQAFGGHATLPAGED